MVLLRIMDWLIELPWPLPRAVPGAGQARRGAWIAALAALLPSLSLAARADDWPQWRGPNRDGVWAEREVLETLPPEGLKLRWRHPVARGFSSPVVAGGRVYVTDAELLEPKVRESFFCLLPVVIGAGGARQLILWTQESVVSLDPANGTVLWREPLPTSADHAVATPVFQEGRLLVGGLMFGLEAARPAATVAWPPTRAVARRVLSNTSTALILERHVYSARSSGTFVALDATSGEQVWETDAVTDLKTGASIHVTRNGGSAFLFTDKGELIRARLSPGGYEERGRVRLIKPTWPFAGRNVAWAAPAFANRCVLARNDEEVLCASLAARR